MVKFGGRVFLASLGLSVLLWASTAHAQVSETFKDWTVVCDNTRVCAAFGYSEMPGAAYVTIERQAGADGRLQAGIAVVNNDEQPYHGPWTVKVDGKVLPGLDKVVFSQGEWTDTFGLEGEAAHRLAEAVRDARSLTLERPGAAPLAIVLSGSSASLRFIDEQQGRVGLSDALVAKGTGSPLSAPPAPERPVIQAAASPAQARLPTTPPPAIANLGKDEDCDTLGSAEDYPPIKVRLGDNLILWGGICSTGAYNGSYKFFTTDDRGGAVQALTFPYAPGAQEKDTVYVTNADFDAETLTMTAFEKGRGIGDCGSIVTWVWDGRAFVLSHQDIMPECRGVELEHWPTLYRATVVQAAG
jgi:hypothetical protein